MTPTYCMFHRHWTDGRCLAGKRNLDRHDLTLRLAAIESILSEEEERQSRGYEGVSALEAERLYLEHLRDTVFR